MRTHASVWGGWPSVRRRLFAGLVLATGALAGSVPAIVFSPQGFRPLETAILILATILFLWLGASFWMAVFGYLARSPRWISEALPISAGGGDDSGAAKNSRTALIMPICNEDVPAVFARLRAIDESLRRTDLDGRYDVYVLSDTSAPDTWIREEIAWRDLCRAVHGWGRIFYRHRSDNKGHKSGNIAEFCIRWGRHYQYMVVLDADSLMSGKTLAELVRRMDRNPHVGLIQAPPVPVNGETFFARLQQFGASVYGPVFTAGAAYWHLGESNYWGHNAIIRVDCFMRHCGLPELPGRLPWGGEVLSHDFVEAALLRRGGWEVWLAPDLDGSYEETPGTLTAYAKRDRRWCQGNLQHLRLISASGFHPMSRLHLAMGAMSYLASPLWLLFLIASFAEAVQQHRTPHDYFSIGTWFPAWPISHTAELVSLLAVTLVLLFGPKVLGFLDLCRRPKQLAAHGGAFAAAFGTIMESVFSVLLAPILMALQTQSVVSVMLGRNVAWVPQKRRDWKVRLGEAAAAYGTMTAVGAIVGFAAFWFAPNFFWWVVPVVAGPVLAIPLSLLLGNVAWGRWCRNRRLLLVPSETSPEPVLKTFRGIQENSRLRSSPGADGPSPVKRAIVDPVVNAIHTMLLRAGGHPPIDHTTARILLQKFSEKGADVLSEEEQRLLLSDIESMVAIHALAWHRDFWRGIAA